jgi:hypothetical protein
VFETSQHRFMSQFKFMQMWIQHEDCKRIIQEAWNINIVGRPMFFKPKTGDLEQNSFW